MAGKWFEPVINRLWFKVVAQDGRMYFHRWNYWNYPRQFPSSKCSLTKEIGNQLSERVSFPFVSWKRSVQWLNESIHHGFKWEERNFFFFFFEKVWLSYSMARLNPLFFSLSLMFPSKRDVPKQMEDRVREKYPPYSNFHIENFKTCSFE